MSARLAMPMTTRRVWNPFFPGGIKGSKQHRNARGSLANAPNLSPAAPIARTTRKRDWDSQDNSSAAVLPLRPRELSRIFGALARPASPAGLWSV